MSHASCGTHRTHTLQGASATVYPFIAIYFQQLGFSSRQIGALFAIRPWITALTGMHRFRSQFRSNV